MSRLKLSEQLANHDGVVPVVFHKPIHFVVEDEHVCTLDCRHDDDESVPSSSDEEGEVVVEEEIEPLTYRRIMTEVFIPRIEPSLKDKSLVMQTLNGLYTDLSRYCMDPDNICDDYSRKRLEYYRIMYRLFDRLYDFAKANFQLLTKYNLYRLLYERKIGDIPYLKLSALKDIICGELIKVIDVIEELYEINNMRNVEFMNLYTDIFINKS